jgi:membrane-bound ClpP family serine protease
MASMLTLGHRREPMPAGTASQIGDGAGLPAPAVGARGKALTDMRPVGSCLLGNQRVECLAEGGVIPAGTPVKVIAVEGMEVRVRPEED